MSELVVEEILPTKFTKSEIHATSSPGYLVRIYPAEGLGKLTSLASGKVLIGRDPNAHVCLEEESVSRRHAIIVNQDGVDTVQDLESTNGTWVNDQRVLAKRLEPGDRLRFGNQIFNYLSASSLEAQYHESVYKMMTTDGLTLAYNRRFLLESLEREIARVRRRNAPLCVLMMDLDKFKSINDTYGHLAGDKVLVEFARRAAAMLSGDEMLARYGGEEFALVLPDTSLKEATQIAELLRLAVANTPVFFEDTRISITVSIGVAQFDHESSSSVSTFLASADQMLYLAKNSGRNQVQYLKG